MRDSVIKRILFLAPLPPPITGQSTACQVLYEELIFAGHDVILVNLSKHSFRSGLDSLERLYQIFFIFLKVLKYSKQVDLIYFTPSESLAGNFKDLLLFAGLRSAISRTIIHLHGGTGMRVLLRRKFSLLRVLNYHYLNRVKAVVVLGERLLSVYDDLVSKDRLHSVPNFAGDELFIDEYALESKFSVSQPLRLLFLSNLLPGKGHKELLEALTLIPPTIGGSIEVDFAGGFESNAQETAFREAASHVSSATVRVHGTVMGIAKRELFRKAHIFCLPTYYPFEGQPISILEAYASGCAVVTTDHAGIFDVFTPRDNGLVVKPGSPESLVEAVTWAVHNKVQLSHFARTNLKEARLKYNRLTHLETLKKVLFSSSSSPDGSK